MAPIDILYLNGPASEALALTGDDTIPFRHRGLALPGIAPGCAMLDIARRPDLGQTLRFR
jgi:hypothetical protein